MTSGVTCPQCHRAVPVGSWNQLCPSCLLRMAKTPLGSWVADEWVQDPKPGADLGDYELLEEVARGGMGIVFKARQRSLDRVVAVKMILAGEWAHPEFALRLQREARAAARLRHPHIVTIHEVGEHEGRQFFSMEFIEGVPLHRAQDSLSARGLEPFVAPLMAKIARAIQFAHDHGVLHRDLKPSNILLDAQAEPHITDFGLAKFVPEWEQAGGMGASRGELTLCGQALGSPNYLPPEQIHPRHGTVSPASDIYSLGAVLYHLLTGRPPFVGATIHQTLAQVEREEPVSPRVINPAVSRDLETVCLKCLEKEPGRRYPTAAALAEDLDRVDQGKPVRARPVSRITRLARTARRHPALSLLSMALLVCLIAGLTSVTWLWQRARQHANLEMQQRQRAERLLDRLDFDRAEMFFASRQPDRGVASLARAVRRNPRDPVLTSRLVSALDRESFHLPLGPYLECDSGIERAMFSPDDRWIAIITWKGAAQLWDARTLTRTGQPLRHPENIGAAAFHPSGTRIATGSADGTVGLWRVPEGTPVAPLLHHNGPVTCVGFNADGSLLASAARDGGVRLWRVEGMPEELRFLNHGSPVLHFQFDASSGALVTAAEDGTVRIWQDPRSGGEPLLLPHPRKVTRVAFRPGRPQLLTVCHDGHLRLWNLPDRTQAFEVLAHAPAKSMTEAVFDASGSRIATCSWDGTANVFDADTGRRVAGPLPHGEATVDAAWCGGGRFLLTASRDNFVRLWDVGAEELLTAPVRHGFLASSVAVSRDGRRLLTASKDRTVRLLDLQPGRDWPRQWTLPDLVADLGLLPDRETLAIATREGIATWSPAGSPKGTVTFRSQEPLVQVASDPGGTRLAGVGWNGLVEVWERAQPDRPLRVLHHGTSIHTVQFKPDGTSLLTAGGHVRIWEMKEDAPAHTLSLPGRSDVARFRQDGRQLVSGCWDGTAQRWNARTLQPEWPPLRHGDAVIDVAYGPAGRWIATASRDQTARIWDAATGLPASPPLQHRHEVLRVVFGPRGQHLATLSLDHHLLLWRVPQGTPAVAGPIRHASRVLALTFSPQGRWLATGTEAGRAQVWSVTAGMPITSGYQHDRAVTGVQFLDQGRRLAVGCLDHSVRVFDLPLFQPPAPPWLPELAESVAGLRLNHADAEEVVPAGAFLALKSRLTGNAPTNDLHRWAQWFLAERATRTISFRDPMTTAEFVQQRREVEPASASSRPWHLLAIPRPKRSP